MRPFLRILWPLAIALLLAGCASKNPIDYLPEGEVYLGVNVPKFYAEQGGKRLAEIFKKLSEQQFISPQAEMVLLSLKGLGPRPTLYLVATTKPGAANVMLEDVAKSAKATNVQVAGMPGYRITAPKSTSQAESMLLVQLSDSALLGALSEKDLETMVATARKKNPSARDTAEFSKCQSLLLNAPFVAVADVAPYIRLLPLDSLTKANPKAAEALQKIQTVSVTAHWDTQPIVECLAYTPEQQAASDLATLVNFMLVMQHATQGQAWQGISASPTQEGLSVTLEIPKETADHWLSELEKMAAELPRDPAQRSAALLTTLTKLFR
ncbi:MAG: hypothetical protein ACPL7D_01735 [Candidatus Sumerlaeaceae bacterium]